jgi:hypothetical protein
VLTKNEKKDHSTTLSIPAPDLWNGEASEASFRLGRVGLLLVVGLPEAEQGIPSLL